MINNILNGLRAGLIAGLILAVLFFVDYGPGELLHNPAHWLALDSKDTGKVVGFILFILLGGVFGILFGILQGRRETTIGRSLLQGAATGVLFWVIVPLLFGAIINHGGLDLGGFLYSFVPLLLYGVILGAFYFQGSSRAERMLHT